MARRVFYSFFYDDDSHRVSQVKNMGVVEGQSILSSNAWESVEDGGDDAIKAYIDTQMAGKSCLVVLIGSSTAGRRWVNYEIEKAWRDGKGVFGVHIHNLKDLSGNQSSKGANPFSGMTVDGDDLGVLAKTYDPPFSTSTNVYDYIKNQLPGWVDTAAEAR